MLDLLDPSKYDVNIKQKQNAKKQKKSHWQQNISKIFKWLNSVIGKPWQLVKNNLRLCPTFVNILGVCGGPQSLRSSRSHWQNRRNIWLENGGQPAIQWSKGWSRDIQSSERELWRWSSSWCRQRQKCPTQWEKCWDVAQTPRNRFLFQDSIFTPSQGDLVRAHRHNRTSKAGGWFQKLWHSLQETLGTNWNGRRSTLAVNSRRSLFESGREFVQFCELSWKTKSQNSFD